MDMEWNGVNSTNITTVSVSVLSAEFDARFGEDRAMSMRNSSKGNHIDKRGSQEGKWPS